MAKFDEVTKEDEILLELQQVIIIVWLARFQTSSPPQCTGVLELQTEMNYQNLAHGLIVKGQKIIVPSGLSGEMVEKLHEGQLEISKTIARACKVLFWPGMTVDLTEKIKNCPVCLENRPSQ